MNVLLTSVGRRTYLIDYFKEVLNGKGEVHAANSCYTYSLSHAHSYVITPGIYDCEYIDFLLDYCKKHGIGVIISLFDIDLPVLSRNKRLFDENGIKVIVSDIDAINICNDKWQTYKFLSDNNIPTPKTYLGRESLLEAISKGEILFPVIMKPRWGMGSIGVYRIDNADELEVLYAKLHRQIFDSYLKYESNASKDDCIILQELINGQEYGLDVLNDLSGNHVTTIAKKKIAMRAGETDIAEIVDPGPFKGIGHALSESLRHIANLDADCFLGEDGVIRVLELNCRFGGQYPFSHMAGVNFPRQIIDWIENRPTDPANITPKIGTVCCKDLRPVIMSERPE